MRRKLRDVWYSFPVQLTILHFRNSLVLILLWIILLLFITGVRGKLFGLQYLFTEPEYMGSVNPISFGFIGIAFGVFVMVWHMSSYLLSAFRFPFLASLSRPFTKFIINNFPIPLIGFLCLFGSIIYVQRYVELKPWLDVAIMLLSCLTGLLLIVILITFYLLFTNKDYRTYVKQLKLQKTNIQMPPVDLHELAYQRYESSDWKIETYLSESLRPRLVRKVEHYPAFILQKVYSQNHKNALLLLITGVFLLIALGFLGDNPFFRIPAGASMFILFSVLMSLASAISFWFRKWRIPVFVLILFIINFITKNEKLKHVNQVYGIDYQQKPLLYDVDSLQSNVDSLEINNDKLKTENVLKNWLIKQPSPKPYAIFLCASGGGQRAGVWALEVMDSLSKITDKNILPMTIAMSGASGGVLGMAYYRAVYELENDHLQFELLKERFSKDMLNSLSFSLVSNDIFPNLASFKYSNKKYFRDRGHAFEQQFNENTLGILNRSLFSLRYAESKALVPMLFITPTIINDGKRLIISPLDVSYMTVPPFHQKSKMLPSDGIEFRDFFKNLEADSLRFLSALRMNCTYPYILPNIFLPTQPAMEIMDAGFGDNFGLSVAYRFIWNFKDWIKANTAGIIIIEMSSGEKRGSITTSSNKGLVEGLISPLGFARTILKHQKYEQGNYVQVMNDYFGENNVHILPFNYQPQQNDQRASMSFHLTQREKNDIHKSLRTEENLKSFRTFKALVNKN
jgi:hypothetical protein